MKALGLIEVNGYVAGVVAADAALKAANVTLIALEKVNAAITNVQISGDVGAVKASVEAGKLAAESLGMLRAYHVIPRLHEETLKLFPSMNEDSQKDIDISVNNSDFKVEEKFKREVIDGKGSIAGKSQEIAEDIIEKNKEVQNIKNNITEKNKDNIIEKVEEMKSDIAEEIKKDVLKGIGEEKNQESKRNRNHKKQKNGKFVLEENSKLKKRDDLVDYSRMKVDELRKLVSNLKLPHLTDKQIKFEKKDELIKILLQYGRKDGK